ncbi:MAG TPA: hypothetical protein VE201_05345 [Nitrospirales bacterium]|jgi:hypothetical protein|nr:hypothetical protein [Nitrospirales bacterium]
MVKPVKRVAVLTLVGLTACASVQPIAAPSAFIGQHHPERVWVAATNGEVFQILSPEIRGDSLVGTLAATSESFAVPLDTEHQVFARRASTGKTMQLVGAIGVVGGLAAWGFIEGGSGAKGCATPGMRGCPPQ